MTSDLLYRARATRIFQCLMSREGFDIHAHRQGERLGAPWQGYRQDDCPASARPASTQHTKLPRRSGSASYEGCGDCLEEAEVAPRQSSRPHHQMMAPGQFRYFLGYHRFRVSPLETPASPTLDSGFTGTSTMNPVVRFMETTNLESEWVSISQLLVCQLYHPGFLVSLCGDQAHLPDGMLGGSSPVVSVSM